MSYLRDLKTTKEFSEDFLKPFVKIMLNRYRFEINEKLEKRKDYKELHTIIYEAMLEFEEKI